VSAASWLEKAVETFDSDGFKDGDMLSHEWIKYALNIPYPKSLDAAEEVQWILLQRVEAFKDFLLTERKIALKTIRGKGYWIVPPADQAQVAAEESMRAIRRGLEKGGKIMENTRLDGLDEQERRRHTDASIRLNGISDLMRRQRRNIFSLFRDHSRIAEKQK